MMEREALRQKVASRKNNEQSQDTQYTPASWDCEYCKKSFKFEKSFMKHFCKEKSRLEYLRSPTGQVTYSYYRDWMRANKRSVPPPETFIHSSFFTTFCKFAEHVNRVMLPSPELFITTMVKHNIQPSLWCRDNVYAMYMGIYEKEVTPETQFLNSIDYLYEYSLRNDVELQKSFESMGVEYFLKQVQKRNLSPWFLAASTVFRTWLKQLPQEGAKRVEESVKVGALMIRIRGNAELTKLFGEFCKATKEFNI